MTARILGGLALAMALGWPQAGRAQTTDGYHAVQVLPVVVDSTSFTQRIVFRNPDVGEALSVSVTFHPADGTPQGPNAEGFECPSLQLPPGGQATVSSLRALCPALAAGSTFGMLVAHSGTFRPFALFSRVSNPAGNGFSVEGFAASEFTVSESVVTGLRRSVATADAPAYQSNCFVGMTPLLQPLPQATQERAVRLTMRSDAGATLGTTTLMLGPGRLVRLLDVFSAVGAPAGDWVDATATVALPPGTMLTGDGEPSLVSFCTVQDNTSFGADFRIAKQEFNGFGIFGAMRSSAHRSPVLVGPIQVPGVVQPNSFAIPPGSSRNAHVVYFRHPDFVSCVLTTVAGLPAPSYGLEMRLSHLDQAGWRVVAGGNDAISTGSIYLGDRASWFENPYVIEVESNGQNEGQARPYVIHCISGSGHTRYEQVLTGGTPQF
jgi:hypothetical protein